MFCRFYFVGDEDLIEIIGGGRDPSSIQRHLPKLFAGIAQFVFNDSVPISRVLGMGSREGETVFFENPVELGAEPRIHDWLNRVENEMRLTLAMLLDKSVGDVEKLVRKSNDRILEYVLVFFNLGQVCHRSRLSRLDRAISCSDCALNA